MVSPSLSQQQAVACVLTFFTEENAHSKKLLHSEQEEYNYTFSALYRLLSAERKMAVVQLQKNWWGYIQPLKQEDVVKRKPAVLCLHQKLSVHIAPYRAGFSQAQDSFWCCFQLTSIWLFLGSPSLLVTLSVKTPWNGISRAMTAISPCSPLDHFLKRLYRYPFCVFSGCGEACGCATRLEKITDSFPRRTFNGFCGTPEISLTKQISCTVCMLPQV